MRFTVESDIERPPEDVFDLLADARNETSWNTQVSRSELVAGDVGAGARFVTVNRGKPYDATITTYRRPEQLAFAVTGGPFAIAVAFTISARGSGSHVVGEYEFVPRGAMRVVFPLLQGAVRKDLATQSQNFKRLCEQA